LLRSPELTGVSKRDTRALRDGLRNGEVGLAGMPRRRNGNDVDVVIPKEALEAARDHFEIVVLERDVPRDTDVQAETVGDVFRSELVRQFDGVVTRGDDPFR